MEDKDKKALTDMEKISTEYIKLLSHIESTVKNGEEPLDEGLLKLWIQLATAIELLGGRVSESTAHILQIPFIPQPKKEESRKKD